MGEWVRQVEFGRVGFEWFWFRVIDPEPYKILAMFMHRAILILCLRFGFGFGWKG